MCRGSSARRHRMGLLTATGLCPQPTCVGSPLRGSSASRPHSCPPMTRTHFSSPPSHAIVWRKAGDARILSPGKIDGNPGITVTCQNCNHEQDAPRSAQSPSTRHTGDRLRRAGWFHSIAGGWPPWPRSARCRRRSGDASPRGLGSGTRQGHAPLSKCKED